MKTFVLTVSLTLALNSFAIAEEIKRRDDAPKPLTPQQSIHRFALPSGFSIELVAAEPLITDPVAIAFDPQGRIFVAEIHGYNVDGHLDITELNKTGVLDKEVRRIPASDETIQQAEAQTFGVVKLLEDTTGDGRMDHVTVWDDKLPACFGVTPARDGVIALCAPDIIYLGDTDHDGKPDVREVLFTGFGVGELWTRINNPLRGIDNWIYAGTGIGAEGTITGPHLKKGSGLFDENSGRRANQRDLTPFSVKLGFSSFRFKVDGSAIEPVTGAAHGFGQTMNAWGDRFLVTNQQHALMAAALPYRYLMRNPHIATPDPILNISDYGHPAKLYPVSTPHPWRAEREKQPQWVKFYGAAETTSGLVTSACGPLVYDADLFPDEYHGDHFSCEPSQNLVHHCKLSRDGLRYSVNRFEHEPDSEFLTSTETWFRPVNLSVGPDGAMYIVDMYREIIEDYSAIPRYLQQQYGLIEGHQRGRIWRVVPTTTQNSVKESTVVAGHSVNGVSDHQPRSVRLPSLSTDELVAALNRDNRWWRQTAQQQLIERQDKSAFEPLSQLVRDGQRYTARLHALHALAALDSLSTKILTVALQDNHFSVRVSALQLAEPWLDKDAVLLNRILAMHDDPEPRVRLQLAMTIGESRDPRGLSVLVAIAQRDGEDSWARSAILSSVRESAGDLLHLLLDASPGKSSMIEPLASIIGARGELQPISRLLQSLAGTDPQSPAIKPTTIPSALLGLVEGLRRAKLSGPLPAEGKTAVAALLASGSGESRDLAFQIARLVSLDQTPEMKSIFDKAASEVVDSQRPLSSRQAAMKLLANAPFASLADVTTDVLDSGQPSQLQITAIESLSASDDDRVTSLLLENWSGYTPKVRAAALEAIFGRTTRLPKLLDAIEQELLAAHEIDAFHRVQLRENSDAKIRDRAKSLLTESTTGASDEVVARYVAVLDRQRDPANGEAVFKKICANCHRLNNVGHAVGPDLAAAKGRADETLLLDILRPSRQITVGYQSYSLVTLDGRVATGILTAETATSITLKKDEGIDQVILRSDIDEMRASPVSLMPEGMEKQIKPQDAADLIGFLRKSLGPTAPESITLLDDDPDFPAMLSEGTGTARIDREDAFAGEASLRITPPQRFSPRIEGWEFRIREKPEPGEYRYLRFAWKASEGDGIMLELADDGQWPDRNEKLRRYTSGKNTTRWKAVEVSPRSPTQWTVVTRDLWKDFGDFILTGIAPTAMDGEALFDQVEVFRSLDVPTVE